MNGRFAVPCSLTPVTHEAHNIRDPKKWATAMMDCRGEYQPEAAKRADAPPSTRSTGPSRKCAPFRWPRTAHGWKAEGDTLPSHPQDNHRAYCFFRFEPAGPQDVPIQAVHVRSELSKHQSWSPKWFRTNEGRAYLDLARPEQRDQLLKFLASQVAASGGKKMRGRSVPDADVSGTEADSAPDEFSGFDLFTRVERVEAEHLGLVARGTTLSNRILAAVGAAGCSGAGDIDRARSLPVLLQEGMNSHPLLVWTFPYYMYALPSFDPLVKTHILLQAPFDRQDLTQGVMSGAAGGYLATGDYVVAGLLAWFLPYAASQPGTDMADLAVLPLLCGTQRPPRGWSDVPHPSGPAPVLA